MNEPNTYDGMIALARRMRDSLKETADAANDVVADSARVHPILSASSERLDLIDWLSTCDPNGVYSDDDSVAQFGSVLSSDEAWQCIRRIVIASH